MGIMWELCGNYSASIRQVWWKYSASIAQAEMEYRGQNFFVIWFYRGENPKYPLCNPAFSGRGKKCRTLGHEKKFRFQKCRKVRHFIKKT